MLNVVLVIHLILALSLVGVILLQRSEGGALGIGGGGGGGGVMSGRSAGNLLTRITAILAACFIGTSLLLAIMANSRPAPTSLMDTPTGLPTAPSIPGMPAMPAQPDSTVPTVPQAPEAR